VDGHSKSVVEFHSIDKWVVGEVSHLYDLWGSMAFRSRDRYAIRARGHGVRSPGTSEW
jgi:hypothetical protein